MATCCQGILPWVLLDHNDNPAFEDIPNTKGKCNPCVLHMQADPATNLPCSLIRLQIGNQSVGCLGLNNRPSLFLHRKSSPPMPGVPMLLTVHMLTSRQCSRLTSRGTPVKSLDYGARCHVPSLRRNSLTSNDLASPRHVDTHTHTHTGELSFQLASLPL